ncbi:MAG: hypothetical protein ACI90V_004758 [Bacillariaceae sp.]|jgi:hypothetical protein
MYSAILLLKLHMMVCDKLATTNGNTVAVLVLVLVAVAYYIIVWLT